MKIKQAKTVLLFALLLLISVLSFQALSANAASPPQAASIPTATLRAASGTTIRFKTQNGQTVGDVSPQTFDLPHLVLYRNGGLTDPDERTLIVEVTGIVAPPTGVTVTIKVETQHSDPDLSDGSDDRIPVWRESQWIANTSDSTLPGVTAVFALEFDQATLSGTETIATPTDYFRYDITVIDVAHPINDPLYTFSEDYAFLMENQWVARLPEVREDSDGAAPDELVVYYCDMFPFQKNIHDPTTWLPREDIPEYVRTELGSQMVEAFRVQTGDWGFPWHQAWTSYRSGQGGDSEQLSVALVDGRTWFHSKAPYRGHARISINASGGENARYDTLTDGLMSAFHHEMFHSLQRNINQKNGGDGDVGGKAGDWQVFSEGTAVLASSVGYSSVQFSPGSEVRAYISNANRFLGSNGLLGDLNTSYERMYPYSTVIYWRFLYEQCGGMTNGVENPAAGMQVINRTLTVLYSGDVVDISSSTDLVRTIPGIMDRVLQGSACPFQTHEQSLTGFARAIHALRLDDGRCTAPGGPAGCGFYDPHNLYRDPPVSTITHSGADQQYSGEIKSSFGMDFVDVALDPTANGQPLTLEFHPAPGADAEFNVQVWRLVDPMEGARPQRIPGQTVPEVLERMNADGRLIYVVSGIDTSAYNQLGLIITRVDARESSDPIGAHTIVLHSEAG